MPFTMSQSSPESPQSLSQSGNLTPPSRTDTKSLIWQYSRSPSSQRPLRCSKGKRIFYCEPCWRKEKTDLQYKTRGGTTHIATHLLKKHGIRAPIKKVKSKLAVSTQTTLNEHSFWAETTKLATRKATGSFADFDPSELDPVILRSLFSNLIAAKHLPFALCSAHEFRAFLHYINPYANKLLPTTRHTVWRDLKSQFMERKALIKLQLQQAISKINFSFDVWTSPHHHGILGVVFHFVSKDHGLQQVVVALQELDGAHTGENFEMEIIELFKEFGILHKIGYMIGDNADNNNTAATWLDLELEALGISWKCGQHRLRCNGHIINLSVLAFLGGCSSKSKFEKFDHSPDDQERWRELGVLGKLHNIIMYIQSSTQRRQEWKQKYSKKVLRRDNATRWNSWYTMCDCALQPATKAALGRYLEDHVEDLPDTLSASDWNLLSHLHSFLEKFLDATKSTEGHEDSLAGVLFSMDYLMQHYKEHETTFANNSVMRRCIKAGRNKLENYFNLTDESAAYAASIVLDPSWKWLHFEEAWKDKPNDILVAKERVLKLWETDYKPTTAVIAESTSQPAAKRQESDFNSYRNRPRPRSTITTSLDDYERYLADPVVEANGDSFNPLAWWIDERRKRDYPALRQMALDILSIPAMSTSVERLFSICKRTATQQRPNLAVETLEMLICLKNWNSSGMVSPFTEQEIQLYAESNMPAENVSNGGSLEEEIDYEAIQDLDEI